MHEQLPIDEYNPIIARHYDYSRFTYPWHFHDEYEIIYVQEGSGTYYVADNMGEFHAGSIFLLGSQLPHYLESEENLISATNAKQRVKGVVIQFQKDFMSFPIDHYIDLKSIKTVLNLSKRGIFFSTKIQSDLIERIEHLPSCKGIERLVNLLLILDLMAKSSDKELLGSRQFNNALSQFSDDRLDKIISYVNYHYTEPVDLATVAAKVPMNVTAFCRYFKAKSGKTFVDYVQDLRIGYACKLLSNKNMDIAQICAASGFNSIAHFNRTFKRKTNLTPTEYKRQFLKEY